MLITEAHAQQTQKRALPRVSTWTLSFELLLAVPCWLVPLVAAGPGRDNRAHST